jgi:hypothetical protein
MRLKAMTKARTIAMAAALLALASGCAAAGSAASSAGASRDQAAVTAKSDTAKSDTARSDTARSDTAKSDTAKSEFSGMGLTFEYPASWRSHAWTADVSSFSALIDDLSTSELRNPCTVTHRPGVTTSTCGLPVRALAPGGILVEWSDIGSPVWHLPKTNLMVGGHQASERITGGGWCTTMLGGTTTIEVMIARTQPANFYGMTACLRGPGISSLEAEISAMLKSVLIDNGY